MTLKPDSPIVNDPLMTQFEGIKAQVRECERPRGDLST
jgi:hypothetical protein